MRHLKKFESSGRIVQSNLEQIKSYFQDIEDEFGIKIRFELGPRKAINNFEIEYYARMFIPIDDFFRGTLSLKRDIDGSIYSENFGEKLKDTFNQISKFYEMLSISTNQLLNDSDFTIVTDYPIRDNNIVFLIKIKE